MRNIQIKTILVYEYNVLSTVEGKSKPKFPNSKLYEFLKFLFLWRQNKNNKKVNNNNATKKFQKAKETKINNNNKSTMIF